MDIHKLLEQVKNKEIDIAKAEELLKNLPYEDLGFAKLDHHRSLRSGFGEVVFCQGKSMEHLIKIYKSFYERDTNVLGTRASQEQYEKVKEILHMVKYDPISHILSIQKEEIEVATKDVTKNGNITNKVQENIENRQQELISKQGFIAVCTGGTSDIPVAEEAAQTAEFFGSQVMRIYDVGVAGIHRLLSKIGEIRQANCIIAVAGMEGALGGVLAGLVDKPVIAVPTSVGYGANLNGIAALLTMLNSCAEGIAVVNIDNGFGAGYMATQINRLANQ
ncbi:MAG: purE2 [Anaerocolumna sp.]|jgi:NCAIR mutase (PurE)-related protein|nr:purE2 [Anaerocolumna sp.]